MVAYSRARLLDRARDAASAAGPGELARLPEQRQRLAAAAPLGGEVRQPDQARGDAGREPEPPAEPHTNLAVSSLTYTGRDAGTKRPRNRGLSNHVGPRAVAAPSLSSDAGG